MPPPPPGAAAPGGSSTLKAAENKIPDTVRDIVKKLDKPTEDVTLDDLNSARQAIAKIEALTEIEKRLVELEKVRHEREKENNLSMAAMIPASALQAPAMQQAFAPPPGMMGNGEAPVPIMPVKSVQEVMRIMGKEGHYSAVLKMSGGGSDDTRTVHVGDHMSDGNNVVEITPTEVVLEHGDTKRTLHIKNVDTVYGHSL